MKRLLLLLAFTLGCITTDRGEVRLDLAEVQRHVAAIELSFREKARILAEADPRLAGDLERVAVGLDQVETTIGEVIASGGGAPDAVAAIDLFLAATEAALGVTANDPDLELRARLAVSFARDLLVQVRLSLERSAPTPP